jgi:AcrR family transcriptional regulator
MARPPKDPVGSRSRLLAAAAQEFAGRGFDGAKVDRIAQRARVNKAMVYYHFTNKAALYREVLRDVFRGAADAVTAVREAGGPPPDQLRAFIAAIAAAAVTRPHFPSIWLREMAEGGRHLDESVIAEMRRVMQTLGGILESGRRVGVFRDVNPFVAQIGIVAPLLLFTASASVRKRFKDQAPYPIADIPSHSVIEYVQAMTLASLDPGTRISAGAPPKRRERP